MRKKNSVIALVCLITMNVDAQIYPYDTTVPSQPTELYDPNIMNMYIRSMAETAAYRKEKYYRYRDLAIEACKDKQWNYAIYYVNEALDTRYYSGQLYFIRGYAYEKLGNIRSAKRNYKAAIKYNFPEAAQALEALKNRNKRRK